MITLEQLMESSSKTTSRKYWEGYKKLHGKYPDNGRRHPVTIRGCVQTADDLNIFYQNLDKERDTLTIGDVDALGNKAYSNQLLATGFSVAANDTHMFVTDDNLFGYPFIQAAGFVTCVHSGGLPYHVRPRAKYLDGTLRTFAEFRDVFYIGLIMLETNEELLNYLNNHHANNQHIGSDTTSA